LIKNNSDQLQFGENIIQVPCFRRFDELLTFLCIMKVFPTFLCFKSVYVLTCANFADLHWGRFTTQWGDKKRTNGADEKYTMGRILKGISGVLCLIFILKLLIWRAIPGYTDCPRYVPRPKGSLFILILHSISVTIVLIALKTRIWYIQYKCIYIFNQDHWRFPLALSPSLLPNLNCLQQLFEWCSIYNEK
jgi:hypothetical protein